jgi:hypothetical protein
MPGYVAYLLSLGKPEDPISGNLHGKSLQGPRSTVAAEQHKQCVVVGFYLILFLRIPLFM